jgi:hypothetical protein
MCVRSATCLPYPYRLVAQPYKTLSACARCQNPGVILSLQHVQFTLLDHVIIPHTTMVDSALDAPEVPILLLGDAEVGKSTFLS